MRSIYRRARMGNQVKTLGCRLLFPRNRTPVLVLVIAPLLLLHTLRAQSSQHPAAANQPATTADLSGAWTPVFPPEPNNPYGRPYMYFTKDVAPMLPWADERYKANRKGQGESRPDQGRADRDPTRY